MLESIIISVIFRSFETLNSYVNIQSNHFQWILRSQKLRVIMGLGFKLGISQYHIRKIHQKKCKKIQIDGEI